MITLSEPKGVTNIGGAKEYAAKFATSVGVGISTLEIKYQNDARSPKTTDRTSEVYVSRCGSVDEFCTDLLPCLSTRWDF